MPTVSVYDGLNEYGTPHIFEDIDLENLSFIDNESHGKSNEFGITPAAIRRGAKLLLSSPNVVAVLVTA